MTTTRHTRTRRVLLCITTFAALATSACATGAPSVPASPTSEQTADGISPPDETDAAASAALAAYMSYWETTDAALAAPGIRDWRPELEAVSQGDALDAVLAEIENYRSLPAHTVGSIDRSPTVVSADTRTVSILDCVDLGDSQLVSDRTGAVLDDLENRVERFHLRAEVVSVGGRWLVQQTSPALDEPC